MSARILRFVGPVHVIGGLLLFLSGFVPATHALMERAFSSTPELVWSPFFVAVLGPTIASWGVLFTALVAQFFSTPTRRLWKALIWSVAIWAPLDSALCLYFGVYAGAVVNTVVVAVLIGLLLAVRPLANKPGAPPRDYA